MERSPEAFQESLWLMNTMKPRNPYDRINAWIGKYLPDSYKHMLNGNDIYGYSDLDMNIDSENIKLKKLYTASDIDELYRLGSGGLSEYAFKTPKMIKIGKTDNKGYVCLTCEKNNKSMVCFDNGGIISNSWDEFYNMIKRAKDSKRSDNRSKLLQRLGDLEKSKGAKLPENYRSLLIDDKCSDLREEFYDLKDFIKTNESLALKEYYQVGVFHTNLAYEGLRIKDMKFGVSDDADYKTFDATSNTIERLADFLNWGERDIPKSKSIKEGVEMEFRSPDMLRTYYMEASEDNDAPDDKETPTEEKDTTKKEDNSSTPEETTSDNVGDDDEIDLSDFGNNGGDDLPNNEYDTSEVETLNKLIASEASALSEYMDAAKTSHEDILQRLYSDIGDEERFHLEQLMFAKSELTGEKYIPRDPAVKKEYEELLELGMDEESAMATAVDKTGLRAQVTVDDGEVPDAEQIENDVQALEYAIMNTELLLTILEQAEENRDQRILDQVCAFNEAFYQETVSNAQTYPREYYKPFNPFDALIKGFFGILNLLAKLIHNLKAHFRAGRFGLQQKLAWFRKHGIEGLLSQGISMYMWDDGRQQFDLQDVCHLANVLFQVTKDCGNAAKLDDSIMQPFNSIQKPFYTENPQYNRKLDLRESLNLISGIHMQPSKIVVQSDDAEAQLIETLFGYTDEMIPKFRPVESDPFVYRSKNIYNRIYYMMEAIEWYGEKTKSVLDQYKLLEGDQKSIYYNNHAAYKQNIENLKVMIKGYNKLVRALSHDVNVLASFDKYGTRSQTEDFDDSHNPNTKGRRATINVADDNKTNPPKVPNHTRTHL